MTTPSTGGYSPGGFNLDAYLADERKKNNAKQTGSTAGTSVNFAWNQGQATYVPPAYNGSPMVPVAAGIPGLPAIYSTSAYANIGKTQWAPKSVVGGPMFFGGGYFTGPQGQAYALELERAARTIHPNSTGNSLWEMAVDQSEWLASTGQIVTPYELIRQYFESGGGVYDAARGGSPGGGGYSYGGGGYGGGYGGGSVGQVNLTNPEDARAVINQLSLQMLGRTVSDKEFKQYYKSLNELEMSSPQTVRMDVDADGNPVQVVEGGLGAEGRTAALQESMRGAKDYNEYTIGSQAADLMMQYLQKRGMFSG